MGDWYDDTAANVVALETSLTEHQKELRRLKRLLAERDTDALECPITREIYEDPVISADGFSYERPERCPHQATVCVLIYARRPRDREMVRPGQAQVAQNK